MARKRGFFAELEYQSRLAAKQREQAQRAQARALVAAERDAERAERRAERAAAAAARAEFAEQKAAQREAKRLHEEAQAAKVEALNAQLAEIADELDSVLSATLGVDDYVDLERFRVVAEHPPFPRADLEVETTREEPASPPPEPEFVEPAAPTGLRAVFGGKKRHASEVESARTDFDERHELWREKAAAVPARQLEQLQRWEAAEEQRRRELRAARDAYEMESQAREAETAESNRKLDELIAGLATGRRDAIQEYVGIVLSNSVYPSILSVEHDYEFDPITRELRLVIFVAPPDRLPEQKLYRYVKAKDEIVATSLAKKDLKDRYAAVVDQVAVRSLHEIFEADREGVVRTITLEVATEAIDPATGRARRVVFIGAAAERESFITYDLSNVVPSATLAHLGAARSKDPFGLVGVDSAPGVRGR